MNYRDTKRRNWAIFWNSTRLLNYMYDDFAWLMLLKARNLICRFFHVARKSTTQGFYSNKNRHQITPKYVSFKNKTQNKIWKLFCYIGIRARVLYVPKLYIHIRRKIKDPTKFVQCCDVRWNLDGRAPKLATFAYDEGTADLPKHLCVSKLARNYFGDS